MKQMVHEHVSDIHSMYVCMCVCVYVCMSVCLYGWMDGCMDGWMYACMHACTYKYFCIGLGVSIQLAFSEKLSVPR